MINANLRNMTEAYIELLKGHIFYLEDNLEIFHQKNVGIIIKNRIEEYTYVDNSIVKRFKEFKIDE